MTQISGTRGSADPPAAVVPPSADRRRDLVASGAIFVLALMVRLLFLAQHADNPTFKNLIVDPELYDQTARAFVHGQGMGFGFFWQPFFYPLFLSVVYAVSGDSVLFARIVQLCIGAVTCVLVYHLGRRVFGWRCGLVAALITVLYGPLIYQESELVGAGWAACGAVTLVSVLLAVVERRTLRWCFAAGICGVVCVLIRPTFLPFFLIAAAYIVLRLRRDGVSWAGLVGRVAAGAAGFALLALPVAFTALYVTRSFALLPASGGLNLYIGNNADRAHTLTIRPGDEWIELQRLAPLAGSETPAESSAYYRNLALQYARTQPGAFVSGLLYKAAQFLNGREIPRNTSIYVYREWSPLLRALVWKVDGLGFPWSILCALGCAGLVLGGHRVPRVMILFLVLFPAAVVLVFVSGRYRVPVVPILAVPAAFGVLELFALLRQRRWPRAGLGLAAALAAGGLPCLLPPAPEEQIHYAAEMYTLLGDTIHERDPKQAIAWYEEALRRQPDCARAHAHLATLLAQSGKNERALAHHTAAITSADHTPMSRAFAYYGRAVLFSDLENWPRALADLDAA